MVLTVLGVVVLIIGLLISVALHELGHMIPAKRFGVRVSEYFVGFGPTLWSKQRGETEYGFKAIPLGGFVRLVGMIPPAEAVKPVRVRGWAGRVIGDARDASVSDIREGEDSRAFYHLEWWKKVIVMAGGPLVNLAIAAVLFTVVLSGFGALESTLTVRDTVACVPSGEANECVAGDPPSPAVAAGILAGDTFVSVDGNAVESWSDLTAYIAAGPGQPMVVVVEREGEPVTINLVPGVRDRAVVDETGAVVLDAAGEPVMEPAGFMGVYPKQEQVSQPLTAGLVMTGASLGHVANAIVHLPVLVLDAGKAALGMQERDAAGVSSVVGVGIFAGEIASADIEGYGVAEKFSDMLMLLAGLNLALFAFNMIPLVPLDGGHIASALWQAIKNGWARARGAAQARPVDVARMMPLAYGVFGVLVLMTVVLMAADIVAPISLT